VIGNTVVLTVSLLVWALLFFYLIRLERRVKDLERK
jgi:CcmD family protein